jgi:Bacterial regulatory proteins, tetR family
MIMAADNAESEVQKIRDAVIEIVGERGYSKTSLEAVLERADLDRATFDRHFSSLQDASGQFATDPTARTMSVSGATVALQANTAALFNQGFAGGKDEFHAGELLGTVAFTAQSQ